MRLDKRPDADVRAQVGLRVTTLGADGVDIELVEGDLAPGRYRLSVTPKGNNECHGNKSHHARLFILEFLPTCS